MAIDDHIIGTCSRCGGRVGVPRIWSAVIPPVPTCQRCGATRRDSHGPVIDMDEAPQIKTSGSAGRS